MTSKYFYIVKEDSELLVLDVLDDEASGYELTVWSPHGRDNQLWKWDGCRLISKMKGGQLAVNVRGELKDSTRCNASPISEDPQNQMWHVEEGVIKSSLNSAFVIGVSESADTYKKVLIQECKEGTAAQKWFFIPENAMEDSKCIRGDPGPLNVNEVLFWKNLADNNIDVIVGCSIEELKAKFDGALKVLDECSEKFDKGAADAGGAGFLGGDVLAMKFFLSRSEQKKAREATMPVFRAILSLQGFLNDYIGKIKKAIEGVNNNDAAYETANFTEKKALEDLQTYEVIMAAGTTSAKILARSFAILGVIGGAYNVVRGVHQIENGSDLAEEFENSKNKLKVEYEKLIKLYEELCPKA